MLKIAAYCRVSTDSKDQANSFESQKVYFESYIKGRDDWKLVNIYADKGISGTQAKKRPEFMRMIRDAENGKINLILTKEISRFARNTVDSLQYTRQLKAAGIGVVFINDNINTLDPDAELRLSIMSSIAQEEVRKISERVKWGQKRRMEQGVVFGNNNIYGYHLENGKLSINENEAKVIRIIFHKYLNEGKGTHIIARELQEEGYRSKNGNKWTAKYVLRALKNEKHCGDLLQKKSYTPNYLEHKKKTNNGEEELVYIRDNHDAIIDRDTWELAQVELARRSPSKELLKKYSNRYWCSGKIRCSHCGNSFIQKVYHQKYGEHKSWVCRNQSVHGLPKLDPYGDMVGCDNVNVNYKSLLFCIEYAINFIVSNDEGIMKDVISTIHIAQSAGADIDNVSLEKKITTLKRKSDKAVELYTDDIITKERVKQLLDTYSADIEALENQLSEQSQIAFDLEKQIISVRLALNSMAKLGKSEDTYKLLIETIHVHRTRRLTLKFKDIPFLVEIEYEAKGMKTWYETTIVNCEIKPI